MMQQGGGPASLAAALALSGALLGALAGCATSPEHTPPPARTDEPTRLTGTHRYEIAGNKGFIEDRAAGELAWSLVYDDHWNLLGTYTDRGKTFRHRGRERPEFLGDYDPDSSLRALYGIQSLEVPVKRAPIGPVQTLDDLAREKESGTPAAGDSSE